MLYKTKDGIKTFLEIIKQAFIDLWDYFKSWFSKKQSIKEAKKVEKHESDRNYMYGNTMNQNNNIRTEYIQIPQKKRGVFF